ncbi:MAG: porin [Pseudomonadota bacterium]
MKKVLFATTALVATAGMAAADVSFGGYGRFGLFYDEGQADETRIEQRFRLTITGTATADNGVEFEGRIRFQTDENAAGASNIARRSAAGFAVTAGGFRLDVGHVSDVVDSGDVLDYYGYGVGLTSFAEQSSGFGIPASGFGVSNDDALIAPTVKLRYSAGDFTVAASYTDDSTGGEEYQIGLGYNFGNYSAGIAFGNEDATDNDFVVAQFGGEIGAFGFSILVADEDNTADTMYGVSAKYDVGAATEIRFVYSDNGTNADETVAIGFRHGLGGGVSLRGGVGQNNAGNTIADLGVIFNF